MSTGDGGSTDGVPGEPLGETPPPKQPAATTASAATTVAIDNVGRAREPSPRLVIRAV
jgi:hypothetical protein